MYQPEWASSYFPGLPAHEEASAAAIHSVHFETEPKNHTENKPNRTDFMVFMVSGFGMV